jgi:hypothetical protein
MALVAWSSGAPAADFLAGVATASITPNGPAWMSGYAARTRPSEAVLQDLWAKALALNDGNGGRVVFVTTDLIGIPRELSDEVFARAHHQFGLRRSELVLSCSHTHCGPAVGRNLSVLFDLSPDDQQRVAAYTSHIADTLVRLIGDALRTQLPAHLAFGQGTADFAINRRQPVDGAVRIGVNPSGPVDHAVPVLKVTRATGGLIAVLFGYACHNTTLGGDFYQINGDYAGQAQAILEQSHPGAAALFMSLCGGDQNPNPRGTVALARTHGESLAAAVNRVLAQDLRPLRPPIRGAACTLQLEFAPHSRDTFAAEASHPDKFRQRRARRILAQYDAGKPPLSTPFPIQAIRFGDDLTLLTLGGEVVVDYALRAKREFPLTNLVVAGYCNDVMCYIPSRRVLNEGGYEAVDSMIFYGMPGPFAPTVEDRIFDGLRDLLSKR